MKKYFLILISILLFYSCEKPCGIASTGPPSFRVEIVDSGTNQNVFTNGTYTKSQLKVTTPNSNSFNYSFISENNLNLIYISPSWSVGIYTTTISLNDNINIPIVSTVEEMSDRCYSNFFITNISVQGFEYALDSNTGVLKIKI